MSRIRVLWFLSGLVILFLVITSLTGCFQGEPPDESKLIKKTHRLVIGGSGTNLPITQTLANKFMEHNPDIKITIPESLGSAGGIKSAASGIINIGLVSRELTTDEKKLGLTYIPYGKVIIVFATNKVLSIDNLTFQQIVDIYSGKVKNWREVGGPDQKIIVLTREYNDSSKIIWDKHIPGFKESKMTPDSILLRTDQAMDEAINNIEYSIGWTDLGSIKINKYSVNLPKLNNITPSYEMVSKLKYPFYKPLGFVYKGKLSPEAMRFIEFVNSSEGSQILLKYGFLPISN